MTLAVGCFLGYVAGWRLSLKCLEIYAVDSLSAFEISW
jgi:hypothetical protein